MVWSPMVLEGYDHVGRGSFVVDFEKDTLLLVVLELVVAVLDPLLYKMVPGHCEAGSLPESMVFEGMAAVVVLSLVR